MTTIKYLDNNTFLEAELGGVAVHKSPCEAGDITVVDLSWISHDFDML